jgi:hypothetical protein
VNLHVASPGTQRARKPLPGEVKPAEVPQPS